jgi:hypothetical protein
MTLTEERKIELHFLYGLEKYLEWKYTKKSREFSLFKEIKDWVLFQDFFSLRKLLIEEIKKGIHSYTETYINLILNKYVEKEIKKDLLLKYICETIDDVFLLDIAKFIRRIPSINLNDFLSQGQIRSKIWLLSELKKYELENKLEFKNIAIYGSWYGFTVPFLYESLENLECVRGFDIDANANYRSEIFLQRYVADKWKYKTITQDVSRLIPLGASGKIKYSLSNDYNQKISETKKFDIIINTSAEHMDDSWLKNLSKEQIVCIQTNNMKDTEGHINVFDTFEKAKDHYRNLGQILWAGTMPLMENYERYMFFLRRRNL